jgi:hypothetical protein
MFSTNPANSSEALRSFDRFGSKERSAFCFANKLGSSHNEPKNYSPEKENPRKSSTPMDN